MKSLYLWALGLRWGGRSASQALPSTQRSERKKAKHVLSPHEPQCVRGSLPAGMGELSAEVHGAEVNWIHLIFSGLIWDVLVGDIHSPANIPILSGI